MALPTLARSFGLNAVAAGAGLLASLIIVWAFGLEQFAYFTINGAKLSLVLLGLELLPSSFIIFRAQDNSAFAEALPAFFYLFAAAALAVTIGLLGAGALTEGSWFMAAYIVVAVLQRYIECRSQAAGLTAAFGWMPAVSNASRVVLLGLLGLSGMAVPDVLWGALALSVMVGQAFMLLRFPALARSVVPHAFGPSLERLWAMRADYYPYYLNAVLKRARDTFLPLFCDAAIADKALVGRFFVFTRAIEAACGQARLLESFLVNRTIRADLRTHERRIFWITGLTGHAAIVVFALGLMAKHGVGASDVALALVAGLFIYPYVIELFKRNDAYAAFAPRAVTISLAAFLFGLIAPVMAALALGRLGVPILLLSYVLGQTLAAATYVLFRAPRTAVIEPDARP